VRQRRSCGGRCEEMAGAYKEKQSGLTRYITLSNTEMDQMKEYLTGLQGSKLEMKEI
jgi:hypothetical protein